MYFLSVINTLKTSVTLVKNTNPLVFLFLVMFCTRSFSQDFSLKELIENTKCQEKACFETFATQKRWKLIEVENQTEFQQRYKYGNEDELSFFSLDKTRDQKNNNTLKTNRVRISVATSSEKKHLEILEELGTLGFPKQMVNDTRENGVGHLSESIMFHGITVLILSLRPSEDKKYRFQVTREY